MDRGVRRLRRGALEGRREVAPRAVLPAAAGAGCERSGERQEQEHHEAAPEGVAPAVRAPASSARAPETACARLAPGSALLLLQPIPLPRVSVRCAVQNCAEPRPKEESAHHPDRGFAARFTRSRDQEYSLPVRDLLDYRDGFPILEHTTYLINHSLGAMPAAAEERLLEYARTWKERGVRAWGEGWWEMPLDGRRPDRADHRRAAGTTVSMHQNVTVAEAIVLSCFEFEARGGGSSTRRVTSPRSATCTRPSGAAAPRSWSSPTTSRVLDAIDERTLLVPVTHVLFKTGEIQDVEAIVAPRARGRRARRARRLPVGRHGAARRDGARRRLRRRRHRSSGSAAGRARAGSTCGPIWRERLEPTLTGWQAHARPFAFEPEHGLRGRAPRAS